MEERKRTIEKGRKETYEKRRKDKRAYLPLESGFQRPLDNIPSKNEPLCEVSVVLDVENFFPPIIF